MRTMFLALALCCAACGPLQAANKETAKAAPMALTAPAFSVAYEAGSTDLQGEPREALMTFVNPETLSTTFGHRRGTPTDNHGAGVWSRCNDGPPLCVMVDDEAAPVVGSIGGGVALEGTVSIVEVPSDNIRPCTMFRAAKVGEAGRYTDSYVCAAVGVVEIRMFRQGKMHAHYLLKSYLGLREPVGSH